MSRVTVLVLDDEDTRRHIKHLRMQASLLEEGVAGKTSLLTGEPISDLVAKLREKANELELALEKQG